MGYKIVLKTFEGPMDLLLHLIEKAQIDIYDIPINEITEQYLDYISKMEELDLEVTSDFLIMASTLLEIKSKLLLPQTKKGANEEMSEEDDDDPRLELVRKLVEYKKYKEVTNRFRQLEDIQNKVYYKPQEDLSPFVDKTDFLEQMELKDLVKALNNIVRKRYGDNSSIILNEIQKEEYTLDDSIAKMKEILKHNKKIKFSQLLGKTFNRKEIVVTFLSLLELIRIKYIKIYQENNFDDIIITKNDKEGVV
ncbi:segregation and condensation protein A [Tepidimicrobium xylanilyticum]|uniref:Segregation and condensation protein A n=1 Tax=Tepidimicrobium xylanilyticum TaxID=1123352 RepID=A0A1H3CUQ0_9FIRM|nr:segregation/condensation protein A [Tepidimicrobium xylanilyticum]GMG97741.1 segregation and condensation protein A [Tepidimicrobium xylanilyticum]SDX57780.1 condensin subunit ScpA [Tepidimicrobium xylanilyticum]